MQRTTVSPSSSTTSRNTPWVAGCCGPMLMSMCSSASPGSAAAVKGTRVARPWASMPGVASSSSTVRLLTARCSLGRFRNDAPLTAAEPVTHVVRQVARGLDDRQLFQRVIRFRIDVERLPYLLGAGETAAQREALPQRVALGVGLPHQDASQVGVATERDAEHVEDFPFQPVRAVPQVKDGIHRQLVCGVQLDLDSNIGAPLEGAEEVHDFERALTVAKLDGRDVHQI